MGLYFRPGNLPFYEISKTKYYVDRTEIIEEVNAQLDTEIGRAHV